MDGPRFDRLARLVAKRSRRQVLWGLAGAATAALFSRSARAQTGCNPNPCDPNASCTEMADSTPVCACNDGYTGNGKTCMATVVNFCRLDSPLELKELMSGQPTGQIYGRIFAQSITEGPGK